MRHRLQIFCAVESTSLQSAKSFGIIVATTCRSVQNRRRCAPSPTQPADRRHVAEYFSLWLLPGHACSVRLARNKILRASRSVCARRGALNPTCPRLQTTEHPGCLRGIRKGWSSHGCQRQVGPEPGRHDPLVGGTCGKPVKGARQLHPHRQGEAPRLSRSHDLENPRERVLRVPTGRDRPRQEREEGVASSRAQPMPGQVRTTGLPHQPEDVTLGPGRQGLTKRGLHVPALEQQPEVSFQVRRAPNGPRVFFAGAARGFRGGVAGLSSAAG